MKAIYKHIAFAALALSVAACTQEDDFSLTYQNDPDAVRITAQVGIDEVTGGFTRSNPTGDETKQTQFNKGDRIAVAAGTQAAVTYTYDGSDWNPETGKYLKWEDERMDVTAYYPVTEGTSATTFTVPEDQTTDIELADYMTYSNNVSKGDNKCIDLTMERKMVRIVVDNITFNGQFDTGYDVTAVTVHGNTSGYADYEVQTGDISVQALKHSDGKFYALLSPTTESADDYFITLTVENSDASESHELKVKGIPVTIAGNSYDLSLTVGKDMASIGNISVTPWERGSISGGEAKDITITSVIENGEAVITVPEGASLDNFAAVITSVIEGGATTLTVKGITGEGEAQQEFLEKLSTILKRGLPEGTKISLTMPDLTNLSWAFNSMTTLVELNAPELLTLCDYAFYYCQSLSSVYLPKVTTMGKIAFASTALTSIDLPEATSLGYQAFYGCEALESVHLPKVTTIGEKAFQMAHGIKSLKFGSVITSIGTLAFASTFPENCDLQLAEGQKDFTPDGSWNYTITDDEVALNGTATEWAGKTWKSINKYVPDSE